MTYGDFEYTYTDNGALETKTDTFTLEVTTYSYDPLGNLLSVDRPMDGSSSTRWTRRDVVWATHRRRLGPGWLYRDLALRFLCASDVALSRY